MAKIHKWKKDQDEKGKKGVKGHKGPKNTPAHAQQHPAPSLPQSVHVTDLRVDEDLSLSIFDDLQPDQELMITPTDPTDGDVYTVVIDPISGTTGVAATDPTTITTAAPDYSEVLSDGGTPTTPVVTLISGPGWVQVTWPFSTGTIDPVAYWVYISTSSGFTPNAPTFLGVTETGQMVINKLPAGTQLQTGTTYYVKVIAASRISGNISGTSTEVSGTPAVVDASVTTLSNLNASTITTGTLAASFIATGTLSADITISGSIKTSASGARVEIDEDGLRHYDGGSTDYGAPSGAGVTAEMAETGELFIRGTINATGLRLDMDTNSSQQDEKSVVWMRDDATVAGFIYDYTDAGNDDSTMRIQATGVTTDGTAHVSVASVAGSETSAIVMHSDDTDNTGYVQATVTGSDSIILLDDASTTSIANLEFDQDTAGETAAPPATGIKLRNTDDGMGRGTLAVYREGVTGLYRDLSRAPVAHGDSLRLNSFIFTDCTQVGTAPATNTLVEDGFLVGYVGTGSTITDGAANAHGGMWTLRMGTTASTSFCNVTAWRDFPLTTAYRIYLGCMIRIPNASNATDRFDFAFGFMVGTDPRAVTDGIFVRYSDSKATPAGTASTFDLVQCNGSARSADALDDNGGAITLSTGQWYMIEMEIIPGTGTSVWITEPGGTKTKKVTDYNTNFPVSVSTNNQFRTLIKRAAGSSNTRDIDVDAIWGHIEYATNRIP